MRVLRKSYTTPCGPGWTISSPALHPLFKHNWATTKYFPVLLTSHLCGLFPWPAISTTFWFISPHVELGCQAQGREEIIHCQSVSRQRQFGQPFCTLWIFPHLSIKCYLGSWNDLPSATIQLFTFVKAARTQTIMRRERTRCWCSLELKIN